jgi:hypothetical protein
VGPQNKARFLLEFELFYLIVLCFGEMQEWLINALNLSFGHSARFLRGIYFLAEDSR